MCIFDGESSWHRLEVCELSVLEQLPKSAPVWLDSVVRSFIITCLCGSAVKLLTAHYN